MVQRIQEEYTPEKLHVVLLSTDATRALYDRRAADLFERYGGGDWPSVILPNAFNDTSKFGGFGYGKVIVDELGIVRSINEFETQKAVERMFKLGYSDANTAPESIARGEYWYNNRSWRSFEEMKIAGTDVSSVVENELKAFADATLTIDENSYSIDSAEFEEGPRGDKLRFKFNGGDQLLITLAHQVTTEATPARAIYYQNLAESGRVKRKTIGAGTLNVALGEGGSIQVKGQVAKGSDKSKTHSINASFHKSIFGLGDSHLEIAGDQAKLSGTLGAMTYKQIKELIANHPEVKTITLLNVERSVNDEVIMHTGRIIRQASLNTQVLADSKIASGGVDLFSAGLQRTIEEGAIIGVHSWSDGTFDGADYPLEHPAHQYQLEYFKTMLGEELGPKFYFYTIQAASARRVHKMSKEEIEQWKLAN